MPFGQPEESPLAARDYTRMNDALSALNRAFRKIDLATAAGIDCESRKAECEYLQSQIEKMKSVYFPHKP